MDNAIYDSEKDEMPHAPRRRLLKLMAAFPLAACLPEIVFAANISGQTQLKAGYAQRLKRILAAGELPYIDIESSCNSTKLDIDAIARSMDQLNIGLMALSADIGKGQFKKGVRYDNLSEQLLGSYPDRFIPVGNGGQAPALTEATDELLDGQETAAREKRILLLGEYEFRHYPSPRQVKCGEMDRDVHVPIDGPIGQRVFAISEQTGLPFQIHYEIEDALLPALENMLQKHPKAKVIWCHVAQIRFIERAPRYSTSYLEGLIKRFPNLYFDTAFGSPDSIYPVNNQRHARIWADNGNLKTEWLDLIVAYPERFLSALDLGGDRLWRIEEWDRNHRNFLKHLPTKTQHHVAYQSAWKLLFDEEFA